MQTQIDETTLASLAGHRANENIAFVCALRILQRRVPDLSVGRATNAMAARGRIYLIKHVLGGGRPTARSANPSGSMV